MSGDADIPIKAASVVRRYLSLAGAVTVLSIGIVATFASAAIADKPAMLTDTFATPNSFSATQNEQCAASVAPNPPCDAYIITIVNDTDSSSGGPVVVHDTLPAGLAVRTIALAWTGLQGEELGTGGSFGEALCKRATATCELPIAVEPDQRLEMLVYVTVEGATGSLENKVEVSGEGTRTVAAHSNNEVSNASAVFGASSVKLFADHADGTPDFQAGDHPYELTTLLDLNSEFRRIPTGGVAANAVEDVKDVVVDLPMGFLGSSQAAPKCSLAQLASSDHCPSGTAVGHLFSSPQSSVSVDSPIYNMTPEHGFAAEFGYQDLLHGTHVLYANVVPTEAGYVLRTVGREVPQVPLTNIVVTFYGDPAEKDRSGQQPVSLFTNPAACEGGTVTTGVYLDSWQHPGRIEADGAPDLSDPNWVASSSRLAEQARAPEESIEPGEITGCNDLTFAPRAVIVEPDTHAADSPSGLDVKIEVPQPESPGVLATPPLRNATVTLPAGLTLDPSVASGLGACTERQIGWLGGSLTNFTAAAPECPENSKIGSVSVQSPLLENTLSGSIYLANPNENPFGSLYAAYIVINDPATGVLVKIPGKVVADEQTGQVTGMFEDNPQLPFSLLTLHFFGGARGALATPETCGTFETSGTLVPWSAPDSGSGTAIASSFVIGENCARTFSPAFAAGAGNTQAAGYTDFRMSFSRTDAESSLSRISVSLPPGVAAKISGTPLCSNEAVERAAGSTGAQETTEPSCPAGSQIGVVQAAAGPGPEPFVLGGKAYLTGPYNGGPYGVAVVVPAIAGPFDLGTVVVRASLRVDPTDAHVTVVSDPFPTILKGVPIRLRRVGIVINRSTFTFNPTDCNPLSTQASFTSVLNDVAVASAPFRVGGCHELQFKPSFQAATQGHTSKADGASLHVKLVPPHEGPQSTGASSGSTSTGSSVQTEEANIAKVKVELPKALPSQLKTLQKACTSAQFDANPAGCPEASIVGMAVARTPILNDPLSGPAYFVSHGNEAFPQLIVVLQGEGVTVDLVGDTFISKAGITSSTFGSVPDVPVSSFELTLPQGKYSALSANGDLCAEKLAMPTEFVAQNGAVIKQSTPIVVEGCSNSISVSSHLLKGRKLTVSVSVPAAGKLTASGKGLSKASKASKGRETIKLTLHTTKGGRFSTKVKLTFTPSTGKDRRKLTKSLAVKFIR
jgi:hypothetical protein